MKKIYCNIHFMQHNFVFQLTFYPFQDKIKQLPLTMCNQIQYGYAPDGKPFWYSFKIQLLIQFRYTPDPEAILILIQRRLQVRSRHGRQSVVRLTNYISTSILGWHLQAHLQHLSIIPLNGIFKPVPYTINHHITKCKFLGTLVTNYLPSSSHDWRDMPI